MLTLKLNAYIVAGFIAYLSCLLGLFLNIAGASAFPYLSLFVILAKNKDKQIIIPLLAFVLILIMSTEYISLYLFIPVYTEYSSYKISMLFVKIVPWFIIPFVLKDKIYDFILGIWFCLFLQIIIVSIIAIKNIHQINLNNRLEVGVINPIWISRSAFELCMLTYYIGIFSSKKLYTFLFVAALIITYASGSKGGIFSFLIIYVLWIFKRFTLKKKIIAGVFGILFLTILINTISKDSYIYQRFFSVMPESSSKESLEESRIVIWSESIMKMGEEDFSSLLFGHGIGSFPNFYYDSDDIGRSYPHNIVLEVLIENGLIFLILICCITYALIRKCKSPLLLLFFYYLINAMFSGDLLLNEYLFLYLFLSIAHQKYLSNEIVILNGRKLFTRTNN